MGYMCLRDLAAVVGLSFDPDPKPEDPITLTEDNFQDAIHHLEHVGWTMQRGAAESWVHFRGWRVNYEANAYAIADAVNAPPALWAGPRRNLPPTAATSGAATAPRAHGGGRSDSQDHRETTRDTRARTALTHGVAVVTGSPYGASNGT